MNIWIPIEDYFFSSKATTFPEITVGRVFNRLVSSSFIKNIFYMKAYVKFIWSTMQTLVRSLLFYI